MSSEPSTDSSSSSTHQSHSFLTLILGSVGVVYGDIGTSPMYALRESLAHITTEGITNTEVMGIVSLLLWSLILVVTLKYVAFIMLADNKGEGGTLSLMALVKSATVKWPGLVFMLGMIGAALFYGDAILTPAISVLSAVEGMKLITTAVEPYILLITISILIALFSLQSHGTARMAAFFGPITLVWFLAMAACAVPYILRYPDILQSFSPYYAIEFLLNHNTVGIVVLGAVFLAVTGAEALYADMGHFGRKPIRYAWMIIVFPALALNYLGQGALIIHNPAALENPFFLLAPKWALIPMVILATLATVIASQAVITGAFSLTQQAIQLGMLPRMEIRHTSEKLAGQIYMPQVNWLLLFGVIVLVLEFRSSSALASAYGIAVTGTMVVTTLLAFLLVWKVWRKPLWVALAITVPFLIIDMTFLTANLMKLMDGGYVPLLLAITIVIIMQTWMRGTRILTEKAHRESIKLADLSEILEASHPTPVPGAAIFLTSDPEVAPASLMHNLKHNKVLHEKNIIMKIAASTIPRVAVENRIEMKEISPQLYCVTVTYGFMEKPDIPEIMKLCKLKGMKLEIMKTSFFLGRRSIKPATRSSMAAWQHKLYIMLSRNATDATDFFNIPPGRVVEMGTQLTI